MVKYTLQKYKGGATKTKRTNKNSKTLKSNPTSRRVKASFKEAAINFKGSEHVPEYHIDNAGGHGTVTINLKQNQEVAVAKHVLSHCDSHIYVHTRSQDGFFKGLFRKFLTGDEIFKTFFTGTQLTNSLTLSHFLPGSIIALKVMPGEQYRISHHSLVAYSSNLKILTKAKFKNILLQQGVFQEAFYNDTNEVGILWLHSYGGHTELILKPGERKKIAHGLFIAADGTTDYGVSTLAGAKTFFFGATTTLLEFYGPCKVYMHNKNYTYLLGDILSHVPHNEGNVGGNKGYKNDGINFKEIKEIERFII